MTSVNTGYNSAIPVETRLQLSIFNFLKSPEIRHNFCFAFSKCAWQFNTISLVSRPSVKHDKHHCLSVQLVVGLILTPFSSQQLIVARSSSSQIIVGHCRPLQVIPCFSNYDTRSLIFCFWSFSKIFILVHYRDYTFGHSSSLQVIVDDCISLQVIVDHCRSLQVIPCFSNYGSEFQSLACPFCFVITFCGHCGMEWDIAC